MSTTLPTEFGPAFLIFALAVVTSYAVKSMEARILRDSACCDSCRQELRDNTKLMIEQTVALRELKEAILGRKG